MNGWDFHEGDEIADGLSAVRLIGGGLRYEAYLAWADHLRALVVVKVVRPDQTRHAGTLNGLRAEIRHLQRLGHPMLVRSFGGDLECDRPHVVLELIDGPRLSTLIRRFGLSLEQILPLALNLCSVVHYLAHERVVHLDVKPRNVIMAGEPRLIDLSIARSVDDLDRLTGPVGTDAYMAPEQCETARLREISPATDIWGLGATLFEAIAGQRPFPADTGERFPQLRLAPRPLPGDVPEPLAAAVHACLAYDPADRPSAAELANVLEPIVGALPAPRIGRFRPSPRPIKSEPREVLG